MKKIIYLLFFGLLLFSTSVNAELDWDNIRKLNNINTEAFFESECYSVNHYNFNHFTLDNYDKFSSKEDSSSIIGIDVQKVYLGNYYNYNTLYTQKNLNELGDTVLSVFQKDISQSTLLKEQNISTFSKYQCFSYRYTIEAVEDYIYNCWYYIIFSDNYKYEVAIYSYDESFINDVNLSSFINSFEIKDTTNICTPKIKNEIVQSDNSDTSVISEWKSPYENYTVKDWISNFIFTAIIYLFFPILIKLCRKKGFKFSTAFWISFSNFILIKLFLSLLFDVTFNVTSAWLYLFIGQAILTECHHSNTETNVNKETFIEERTPFPGEILDILSDKDRIKNILDGKEKMDENLFLGIENPYNGNKIETKEDIMQYLHYFYLSYFEDSTENYDINTKN